MRCWRSLFLQALQHWFIPPSWALQSQLDPEQQTQITIVATINQQPCADLYHKVNKKREFTPTVYTLTKFNIGIMCGQFNLEVGRALAAFERRIKGPRTTLQGQNPFKLQFSCLSAWLDTTWGGGYVKNIMEIRNEAYDEQAGRSSKRLMRKEMHIRTRMDGWTSLSCHTTPQPPVTDPDKHGSRGGGALLWKNTKSKDSPVGYIRNTQTPWINAVHLPTAMGYRSQEHCEWLWAIM